MLLGNAALDLERISCVAVYAGSESSRISSKIYCVPKMNEGLTGLNDMTVSN